MSIGFIFRNTVTAAKSVVPTAVKAVVSSGMLTRKVSSVSQILSANATTRIHAGTIIRHGNIFTIIRMFRKLGVKACRSHHARQLKFLLLFRRLLYTLKWWREALQIMAGILYTATYAESSVKRRRQDFSAFTKSGLPTNGAEPRSIGKQTYSAR